MELFKKCFLQYECKKIFFQNSTKDRMTYNNISVVGKYQRDHQKQVALVLKIDFQKIMKSRINEIQRVIYSIHQWHAGGNNS